LEPPIDKCNTFIAGYKQYLKKIKIKLFKSNSIKHNISDKDRESLNKLTNNKNIVIQKADKGGSITILNTLSTWLK